MKLIFIFGASAVGNWNYAICGGLRWTWTDYHGNEF